MQVDTTYTKQNKQTTMTTDYTQLAQMIETPASKTYRSFDHVTISGAVKTEVVKDGKQELEKRLPATATRFMYSSRPLQADGRAEKVTLPLPLTFIPIKYRMVMEHRTGAEGETLLLKSSEFNGNKQTDKVVIKRYTLEGKVEKLFGPMTVKQARDMFVDAQGKRLLKDKVNLYGMLDGELVRLAVKGSALWENRQALSAGKTEASRAPYPFLNEYFSTFKMDDPYFLYEMKIDAAYRDGKAVRYYRPIFTKGARIAPAVEATVIKHLKDLHQYFTDMDNATMEYVASELEDVEPIETSAEELHIEGSTGGEEKIPF